MLQYQKAVEERELAEFEREQQRMAAMDLTAESHRKRVLKRKAWKCCRKYVKLEQLERQIEEENQSRKTAIDEFFINLKEKARLEEERARREKIEAQEKEEVKEKMREVSRAHRNVVDVRAETPNMFNTSNIESSIPYNVTPSQMS